MALRGEVGAVGAVALRVLAYIGKRSKFEH